MDWSADQYVKFEDERSRPVRDLVARIPNAVVNNAVDIGCGPGNSTEVLRKQYTHATIQGIDSSADMIAAARKRLPDIPFAVEDIATWSGTGGPFDVILSNAVLQWLPDHATLLPSLLDKLAPGGSLAVQMPDNFQEPAHRLMREVADSGPWREKLVGAARALSSRHSPEDYYRILHDAGATVDLWRTTYYHPLTGGAAAIVEWFKGTGLRPFLQPLTEDEQAVFLERYTARIAQAYPTLADGTALLPFPRLFFIATR